MSQQFITVNGRFLCQKVSGVQRYAREIISALDQHLEESGSPLSSATWQIVAPPGTQCDLNLKKIVFREWGRGNGHVWEQLHLRRAPGLLLNLGNSGPVFRTKSMVVIHDVGVFRTPENYGTLYANLHKCLGKMLALSSNVGTVSDFSRHEITEVLRVPKERVFVAPNGADHLNESFADPAILGRLGIETDRFFLFVGSPTRNKNLKLAIDALAIMNDPSVKMVVVGSLSNSVFKDSTDLNKSGVVLPGYLEDTEICSLYQHATALVFPSLYEGFGIPPLEAMKLGCPVLVSDIPTGREVCGDVAEYFSPTDAKGLADLMAHRLAHQDERAEIVKKGRERAAQWTWSASAARILTAIEKHAAS